MHHTPSAQQKDARLFHIPERWHKVMEPDELDLQLINVLQVRPRARWSHVAPILSISAGACATRWKRLRGNGLAWTTAHPALGGARPMSGIIEVRTPPAQRRELITQACLDPRVVGVDELVVGGGLLLSVAVARLDDYRRLRDGLQVGPAEVWTLSTPTSSPCSDACQPGTSRPVTPPEATSTRFSPCSPATPAPRRPRCRGSSDATREPCGSRSVSCCTQTSSACDATPPTRRSAGR
jgi:DNA-binding Lrp family transcriptional regulator